MGRAEFDLAGSLSIIQGMDMVSWMVTAQKVEAAIKGIIEVARPRRLILFGSYVRGEITANSDLDILVVPESELQKAAHIPSLIYREALAHSKVVHESA